MKLKALMIHLFPQKYFLMAAKRLYSATNVINNITCQSLTNVVCLTLKGKTSNCHVLVKPFVVCQPK